MKLEASISGPDSRGKKTSVREKRARHQIRLMTGADEPNRKEGQWETLFDRD